MHKRSLTWLIAALMTAGLTLIACGDDSTSTNNGGTNNGGTNNGGTNNGGSNNGAVDMGGNNGGMDAGNNGEVDMNFMEPPPPPGCDDDMPPARCSVPAADVTWAPSSVLDELVIMGKGADDPECCFDFNDDDEIDNALGGLLADFKQDGTPFKDTVNQGIEDSIAEGSLVVALEHDTIDALDSQQEFTINFWLGEWPMDWTEIDPAGANDLMIDPASIDGDPATSSQPEAYVPDATLMTDGTVEAGPGVVQLSIEVLGTPLQLKVSQARITAEVDPTASALDGTGVALTNGKLGGVIRADDIIVAINAFASTCDCLGIDGELVSTDPETGATMCDPERNQQACEDAGEDSCAQLSGSCGLLSALGALSDIDLDGDGVTDAISIGAQFTTKGANITGLAPAGTN